MKLNTRENQPDKNVKLTYGTYKFSNFSTINYIPMMHANEFF